MDVVVIGFNDAPHIGEAVASALAQGPSVRQVIAVDDRSTDGSDRVLDDLASGEPRLRVIRRPGNSGGCGTPRNNGLDAARAPYVMFLDSDDLLPEGAVDALLTAADTHGAEVTAGLCVRRELPSGEETAWHPELYARAAVVDRPVDRPALAQDTLCVNKLYRTDFLREHAVRFPEGRFPYEDFVFTARVLSAGPRVALVPDTVYIWHVRRAATRLSISLDRADIANWRARVEAHRQVVRTFVDAGQDSLVREARIAFLDRGLRMYLRELEHRGADYQRTWWELTRQHLATFDPADIAAAPAPSRVTARVVLASPVPRDLARLKELASRPSRLLPPYARAPDSTPVWAQDLPEVTLKHLLKRPLRLLPIAVGAELRPRARVSTLVLHVHDMYGRLAMASPLAIDAEFTHRASGRKGPRRTAALTLGPGPDEWSADIRLRLTELAGGAWDLRVRIRFADGSDRDTTAHAVAGPGLLRRSAVPSSRHGVVLVQPYATHSGALSLRIAPGPRGAGVVLRRRLARLVGTG
ncbi:transferase [Streptomyces tsukubensis]|uniref:Transferase n=1 Tax=Streptomyces tsukubensis TaxID=83656 RepID=A0A1V4A031_9ACTN|nr:transferase [Streptomyces tsukubensis]